MPRLPTGTVTFLFADIEGSTVLLEQLGERYAGILADYRRLLRGAAKAHGGREVDTQGDALFAAFPRARDAVLAAVAAQRAITEHTWPEKVSVRVRMGLHTGEPLSAEAGYVGMAVHRAARICAAGHGGQVLLSETTRDLLLDDLPDAINLRDLGEHRLKDLPRPQRLFQLAAAGLPTDFPPLRSLEMLPNNLPRQFTSFVGREKEIAEVKDLLFRTSLLTLTGAGGSGKTRLAIQVAAHLLEQFPDGVWLVDLAPLADPTLVVQTVASVLGVREQPSRPLLATLTDYLRTKTLLLVLDNCEHLVDACARMGEALLQTSLGLRILTTSRQPLEIPGEHVYRVPTLSVPNTRRLPAIANLEEYESVKLFTERAASVLPTFRVTEENAMTIAQVCQRLDGIPLAIELAAARVRVLTVEQIASRLEDRFQLLTGGQKTALPRHQTLRATMDWSYSLLAEKERMLLQRLAIFAGGWTVEAAEGVCSSAGLEVREVLDLLTRLADKSLVVVGAERAEARYRLQETVGEYGLEQLRVSADIDTIQRRHRDFFLQLAERAEPELLGPGQKAWLDRLDTEHDNLRAALEWTAAADGEGEAGYRLVNAVWWFWYVRGYLTEGRAWLERVLALSPGTARPLRIRALQGAGRLAARQGDDDRAKALYLESQALCRELEDKGGMARSLQGLARVGTHQADFAAARAWAEESLAIFEELGDKRGMALSFNELGEIARSLRDYEHAGAFYERSLALWRELADRVPTVSLLQNLGYVALNRSDLRKARAIFAEGLALSRDVRDMLGIASCLGGLAGVAALSGQRERAARLFGAAEATHQAGGLTPDPVDRAEIDRNVSTVRTASPEDAFLRLSAEGRAMTLERAIEYALQEDS